MQHIIISQSVHSLVSTETSMQATLQPWKADTRCSFCCSSCLGAIAPVGKGCLMTKESYREVRTRSRTVAASTAQHAQSKSAASTEALREQDMPQIGSRPLRSQKSDQGQPQARPQQSSSAKPEPEAHAPSDLWHQPAPSRHSMADARWRPPAQGRGVIAGTRSLSKASVSHSSGDISRHRGLGHARLQRYWSALEEGMLQGENHVITCCHVKSQSHRSCLLACTAPTSTSLCCCKRGAQQQSSQGVDGAGGAADGRMGQEWARQEQRALCRACQEAVADGQLAEVLRLLQRPQLGQQIADKGLAWHLVEVQCLALHLSDFADVLLMPVFMLYIHPGDLLHSWACPSWYEAAHANADAVHHQPCGA